MATLLKGKNNILNFLLKTQAGKFIERTEAADMVFDGMEYIISHMPDDAWKSNFYNKRWFMMNHTLPDTVFLCLSENEQKNIGNDMELARRYFRAWFAETYKNFLFTRVEDYGPYIKDYHGTFYIFDKEKNEI